MKIGETILDQIPLEIIEKFLELRESKEEMILSQRYEDADELRKKEREIIRIYPDLVVDWKYNENIKEYCIKRRRDEKINTIIDENF